MLVLFDRSRPGGYEFALPDGLVSRYPPGRTQRLSTMFTHRRTLRIEWGDCDAAGIVYFPRYVEYFDACTVHLFEAAGFPKHAMLERFGMAGYPMVDLKMKFLIPSTFGEDVTVESSITEFKRSSFNVHHRLLRGEELAVEGFETRVWTIFDPERPGRLKSQAVPDEVKAAFA